MRLPYVHTQLEVRRPPDQGALPPARHVLGEQGTVLPQVKAGLGGGNDRVPDRAGLVQQVAGKQSARAGGPPQVLPAQLGVPGSSPGSA